MTIPHPIQRRYLAEEFARVRRSDEHDRTAACQRQGRIDPNPHQIDAVMFALRRIPEGGCVLADEVGLGKTIEAGLVLAQLRAEGARRFLVIVPKPLVGQWQEELRSLFGVEAHEGRTAAEIGQPGVLLVGREFAGSERGSELLAGSPPFDLCIIDEAHEIFAGIYKRYDRFGGVRQESQDARMAHRVRSFLGDTPVLLLTATPIQNSLAELWGLVQYVEPTGSLLGDLNTFRDVFCDGDDRKLVAGQEHELRRRIATVCRRTLRRQAQEFLERPFVDRSCQLFGYHMSAEEQSLYDAVTDYLLEPDLCAFAGNQRRLLLIGFHRRMASSVRALAASLERVAQRLRAMSSEGATADTGTLARALASDLEDEDLLVEEESVREEMPRVLPSTDRVRSELARVERFIERARALPHDSKASCLLEAIRTITERGLEARGSGKAVIFTESLTTQDYLRELLLQQGGLAEHEVTLFRGQNDSPRARAALERWHQEIGRNLPAYKRPSREVATRLALVHEFRTASRVLVATEAGAKGLNLQFCDTVINFDLPWNPQRIEQRIGRCHRYGQERGVTVVNFLAEDNEAHRLTFEILSDKLDLFGKVLDASDNVLHEAGERASDGVVSALGVDFETQLRRIYERSRSKDEIVQELRQLRESVDKQREVYEEGWRRTAGLIESRFDVEVRKVFRQLREQLPQALAGFDRSIDRLVVGYLGASGVQFVRTEARDHVIFDVSASAALPEPLSAGGRFLVGDAKHHELGDPLHAGHPLVSAAIEEARSATRERARVRLHVDASAPGGAQARRGRRGRLVVIKVAYAGLEPVERLLPVALVEGDTTPLAPELTRSLLALDVEDAPPFAPPIAIHDAALEDAVEESVFFDQAEVENKEQERFDQALHQIDRFADDRARLVRRQLSDLERKIAALREQRDAALATETRGAAERALTRVEGEQAELDARLQALETRQDERYSTLRERLHQRRYAPAQRSIVLDVEFVLA